MTIKLKTKNLLNKYRYVYHVELAKKRGIVISADTINLSKSDVEIQKKISRLIFVKKLKEYFSIKNIFKHFIF